MLDFKEPKITDKPWVDQCLSHAHSMNCEYTFGNIYVWRTAYVTRICHYKDFLLIRYAWQAKDLRIYSVCVRMI